MTRLLTALFLISLMGGNAYAEENCKDKCPWVSYSYPACMEACRAANTLERIENKLNSNEDDWEEDEVEQVTFKTSSNFQ